MGAALLCGAGAARYLRRHRALQEVLSKGTRLADDTEMAPARAVGADEHGGTLSVWTGQAADEVPAWVAPASLGMDILGREAAPAPAPQHPEVPEVPEDRSGCGTELEQF